MAGSLALKLTVLGQPIYEFRNLLSTVYWRLKTGIIYKHVFGGMGKDCLVRRPMFLGNPHNIYLGNRVQIREGARLEAITHSPGRIPKLSIGNNVNIEQNVHIVCQSRIDIGNNVSITGNCAIIDTTHPYQDVNDPLKIGARILDEDSFVQIGDGTFIGYGALVMPNVRIGTHCVVGAHSVVTADVADYSVVAGNPARTIRRYDSTLREWVSVKQRSN
jgi:acetyltransferase-like isoleucine patch superfamily enzyme